MQSRQPTKENIIAVLRRIQARDGHVNLPAFKEETGWDRYWFDKFWPLGGYQSACEEAEVQRGAIFGVETNLRITDEELAVRFAEVVRQYGRIPSPKRFAAIARMAPETMKRGDTWDDAKRRIIKVYLGFAPEQRISDAVDAELRNELSRLNGADHQTAAARPMSPPPEAAHPVNVPPAYVAHVRELRDRGEEEKRQLVAQFFHEILGYKRTRVRSEHEHNDVRVHDRRGNPWIVVEVKARLETERERRIARRQAFDYAHRHGMRYVVVSDSDLYEVFDRCAGQRLRYEEMFQGAFRISALRSRDSDLLALLAAER
jgi:hypothetical protein